jgi:hypothetical protein
MVAALIDASTRDLVMSVPSSSNFPLMLVKLTFHVRDHHVPDLELCGRMGRVNISSGGYDFRPNNHAHKI